MKKFLKSFGIERLFDEKKLKKFGSIWYAVDSDVGIVLKKIKLPALSAGLCIGQFNEKQRPSPDTLHLLSKTKAKKVWVNKKGEWMFICKRTVLKESMTKTDAQKGDRVLVMNQHNECLGFGIFTGKLIRNEYDIGDFLRRERT